MNENNTISPPSDHYYLFKSCTAGSVYPGIELSIRYILDTLKLNMLTIQDNHHAQDSVSIWVLCLWIQTWHLMPVIYH